MKVKEIVELMEKWAPVDLAEEWDNTGLQIGRLDKDIVNILIALDLDNDVLDYAIRKKVDMIISHHPIIFKPLEKITSNNENEKLILKIISNDIVAFNAHTNLDIAKGGVNDVLADLLGLRNLVSLVKSNSLGLGRVGDIDEIQMEGYLDIIKDRLNAPHLLIYGDINRKVRKVACCGGSGGDYIYDAYASGADIYITGDIKYHEGEYAKSLGIAVVDAGHYYTELPIVSKIKKHLDNSVNFGLNILTYQKIDPPYTIY